MTMTAATVFIVDDDPSVRKSLLRLIRSGGWHGEAFASAHEFLARPAFSGTGCLILDVLMPGMMGTELCGVMAARNIALPVIFLTGSVDLPKGVDAWNEGAVGFLLKPVDADTLVQAIRKALEGHAAAYNH
jgi:FixJ family two-component response regulator